MKKFIFFIISTIVFLFLLFSIFFYKSYDYKDYQITSSLFKSQIKRNNKSLIKKNYYIKDFDFSDVNKDGNLELALVYKNYLTRKSLVEVYSLKENPELILSKELSKYKPWRVKFGNILGDEEEELLIGFIKKTPLHPIMDKRCFAYKIDWKNKSYIPMYRASRFLQSFTDFTSCDLDKDGYAELFLIEKNRDGSNRLTCYKWHGYGYQLFYKSKDYKKLKEFTKSEKLKVDGREVFLQDEKLIIGEKNENL